MNYAKPFVKWAGGKGQLLSQLEALLPKGFDERREVRYIEPFVGGGAMLFHMLQRHRCITSAVINDINPYLTTCYRVVRDNPHELIDSLQEMQQAYLALPNDDRRKEEYLHRRNLFNEQEHSDIERAALFIFLNRTCFNGLYRVNRAGRFNVPHGRYDNPTICDRDTILSDSRLMQRVEILTGDFSQTLQCISGDTFFYFDPPYRPLSATSNFNDYAKEAFNDEAQIRLKQFCDTLDTRGAEFMLSNSDCLSADGTDRFFDDLYDAYNIDRVRASRSINSDPTKRGKLTEIVVSNYDKALSTTQLALNF